MDKNDLSRRGFFKTAGTFAAGAAASSGISCGSPGKSAGAEETDALKLRTLGRTGLKVTEVCFGTGGAGVEVDVLKYGFDKGINFVHTALGYTNGNSIRNVEKAIKGRRDDLLVALKITWDPKDDAPLEKALKLMGISHVDLVMFPLGTVEKVKNPEVPMAFERWKKAGKARYMGLTSHKGVNAVMQAGIDTDWYDVIMPAYNLNMKKQVEPILKQCREKNLAFLLMKAAKDLSGMTFEEAIPLYLDEPATTSICKGMRTYDEVDAAIAATHQKVTSELRKKGDLLASMKIPGACGMCGQCTDACPNGLAVNDMVRSVTYYMDVTKHVDEGQEVYAEIPVSRNASACRDCGTCERVCPKGVPIRA